MPFSPMTIPGRVLALVQVQGPRGRSAGTQRSPQPASPDWRPRRRTAMSWAGGYGPRLTGILDGELLFLRGLDNSTSTYCAPRAAGAIAAGVQDRIRWVWRNSGGGCRVRALPGDFSLHSHQIRSLGTRLVIAALRPVSERSRGVVLLYSDEFTDASAVRNESVVEEPNYHD